jgi:hypothetical protein
MNDEQLVNDSIAAGEVRKLVDGCYEVTMTLQVDAADEAEALQRAMTWRDVVTGRAGLASLDFRWHLDHPWGC